MRIGFRRNLRAGLTGAVLIVTIITGLACGSGAAPVNEVTTGNPTATAADRVETPPSATGEPVAANSPTPIPLSPTTLPSAPAAAESAANLTSAPEPTARPTPTPTTPLTDWEREMRTAGVYRGDWKTDFSKHSIPYNEIFSGGVPRDGIPPLDFPSFTTVAQADDWLEAREPVIAFELNGETKAYPLQVLTWHEIVNDTVGGVPVVATFCPLCNSAIVFDRRLDGEVYDFGVSGNLRNSDLIMWDRQTESWWQQLTGEGIVGELTGKQLALLPATIIAWEDFKATYPDSAVLSRETGFPPGLWPQPLRRLRPGGPLALPLLWQG